MATQRVIITVDDAGLAGITELVAELTRNGLVVEQLNRITGVIVGSAPEDRREQLERLPGVMSIRPEGAFRIAPPDAELQ